MTKRPTIPGSVTRRGDRWLAQLPPSLGRRSRLKDTNDEAWRWLGEEYAKSVLNLSPAGEGAGGPTVTELIRAWLQVSLLKPTTRTDYAIRIDAHVVAHPVGSMRAMDVRGMHVDALLTATPHNWTRIHVAKILSPFFDWAEANGYTDGNPYRRSGAKRIVQVAHRHVERRESTDNTWTPEQLVLFIAHEPDPVYRDYWAFVAATGARRGESIGLTWPSVHEEEGWCWLERNVTTAGSEIFDDDTPKNWKRRKAYFGEVIGQALAARRVEQASYRALCASWAGDWVFDRRRGWGKRYEPGTHLAPATVTQRFNRHTEELGLPHLSGPHGLRRTFGTLAEEEGFRPSVRSAALGHTPDLLGRYSKPNEADLRELADRLAKLLLGG